MLWCLNQLMKKALFFATYFFSSFFSWSEIWINQEGKKVEAHFISLSADEVVTFEKKNGKEFRYALSKLNAGS